MSMLVDRKGKTKWISPGRQALWKQDFGGMKYGRELMEKMGWQIGQGLGVNSQGITEPLKISVKNDNKGIGCKGSNDNEWIQQQSEFNLLLNKLYSSEQFQNKRVTQDAKKNGVHSLEEKSKLSKARIQYNKFIRGKDFTKYSKKDMECILGCKEKEKNQEDNRSCKSHVEDTGLITINSGSMVDYFAKKMQYKTDSKMCFPAGEQNLIKSFSDGEDKNVQEKELKKKEKRKSKKSKEHLKEYPNENYNCSELMLNVLNDCEIKSDMDEKYNYIKTEVNPENSSKRKSYDVDLTARKHSEDKSKEQQKQWSLYLEENTAKEESKEKKNKNKKNKSNENFLKRPETLDDNNKANEKSKGHSEHNEVFYVTAKEIGVKFNADEKSDFVIKKMAKKKRKKHFREVENAVQEEERKKKNNFDDFKVISDTESGLTRNKKDQYMKKTKLTPSSDSLLYKTELLKTSNGIEKNMQQNKLLSLIYCMNTEKFNGSNLSSLNGYGM